MRWIFSAGIPIAHLDRKGLADAVFWRLWQRRRRAYRQLGVDDEVWLREGAGRHAVLRWRTRVREVLRHDYVSKTDAARVLARDLALDRREFLDHPYTMRAPERGLLLAVVFEPVEELDVPFPDELRMPQDGFLPLDGVADSKLHAWGLLTSHPDRSRPRREHWTGGGQGRVPDAVRRALIEDYAQDALMRCFRRRGFEVVDARRGHPYDAVATKAGQRLYLEAKGTTSTEPVVEITRNELEHARRHRDDCVLGVVVDITFVGATEQDPGRPAGGKLYVFQPWDPDHGELTPTRYRHTPSGAASEPALRL